MLNIHFIIERSVDQSRERTTPDLMWCVEADTYIMVPGSLTFHSLVQHALSSLGYSDVETVGCKGTRTNIIHIIIHVSKFIILCSHSLYYLVTNGFV